MSHIEREVKILNVDVYKIIETLKQNEIKSKGCYIQEIYTYDLDTVDVRYQKAIRMLINDNDNRAIVKLVNEIKPCFTIDNLATFKKILKTEDILNFIEQKNNLNLLYSNEIIKIMQDMNKYYSEWIRLRKTGDEVKITIKSNTTPNGIYELDNAKEVEQNVSNIESGIEFLEKLGFYHKRLQQKMRIAYDYKNTEIVIDKWPLLNPYIEVEGNTKEEIIEAVNMLGYTLDDAIITNTDELYKEINIDIYSPKYKNLSFSEEEKKEVQNYMEASKEKDLAKKR